MGVYFLKYIRYEYLIDIQDKNYDYIINCIGKPDLEYCENNVQETNYSNRDILLDIQKYYPKSKIINFSSYYVYDNEGLNNETSRVTYSYNYTRQKLEGEKLINNGVSFRIGKLFGYSQIDKQNNFKTIKQVIEETLNDKLNMYVFFVLFYSVNT